VNLKFTIENRILLSIFLLAGFASLLLAGCYIDKSIDSGEGYGFRIGDDKQESFLNARRAFNEKTTYILYPIDKQGFGPHEKIEFNEDEFSQIESRDTWDFYFDSGYKDSLKLQFSDGRLTQIHRFKQYVELP